MIGEWTCRMYGEMSLVLAKTGCGIFSRSCCDWVGSYLVLVSPPVVDWPSLTPTPLSNTNTNSTTLTNPLTYCILY